jgi:hypothetical protein
MEIIILLGRLRHVIHASDGSDLTLPLIEDSGSVLNHSINHCLYPSSQIERRTRIVSLNTIEDRVGSPEKLAVVQRGDPIDPVVCGAHRVIHDLVPGKEPSETWVGPVETLIRLHFGV